MLTRVAACLRLHERARPRAPVPLLLPVPAHASGDMAGVGRPVTASVHQASAHPVY